MSDRNKCVVICSVPEKDSGPSICLPKCNFKIWKCIKYSCFMRVFLRLKNKARIGWM